jgi:hypothetical protein
MQSSPALTGRRIIELGITLAASFAAAEYMHLIESGDAQKAAPDAFASAAPQRFRRRDL